MEKMGNSLPIWATPDDAAWDKMTADVQKDLDSKNYEKMKYFPYLEQISKIVEEEMGFKPDFRVRTFQAIDSFKRDQGQASQLLKSWKEKDQDGFTVAQYLDIMSDEFMNAISKYNGAAWNKWYSNLLQRTWTDEVGAIPHIQAVKTKMRDRLAAEVPLLN
jgi:hypothetical protein